MSKESRIKRGQLVSILNHDYLYGLVIQNDISDDTENIVIMAGEFTSCNNKGANFHKVKGTNITLDVNRLFSIPKSDIINRPLKVLDEKEMGIISNRLKETLGIKVENIVVSDFLNALYEYYNYYESLSSDTIEDRYHKNEVLRNVEKQIDNLVIISNYTKPEIYKKLKIRER